MYRSPVSGVCLSHLSVNISSNWLIDVTCLFSNSDCICSSSKHVKLQFNILFSDGRILLGGDTHQSRAWVSPPGWETTQSHHGKSPEVTSHLYTQMWTLFICSRRLLLTVLVGTSPVFRPVPHIITSWGPARATAADRWGTTPSCSVSRQLSSDWTTNSSDWPRVCKISAQDAVIFFSLRHLPPATELGQSDREIFLTKYQLTCCQTCQYKWHRALELILKISSLQSFDLNLFNGRWCPTTQYLHSNWTQTCSLVYYTLNLTTFYSVVNCIQSQLHYYWRTDWSFLKSRNVHWNFRILHCWERTGWVQVLEPSYFTTINSIQSCLAWDLGRDLPVL